MRYSMVAGVLALTTGSASVLAQNIGPTGTNPLDTGNGTTLPGTGVSTTGLTPQTNAVQPPVTPRFTSPVVPPSTNVPVSTPITIPGRTVPMANPNGVRPNTVPVASAPIDQVPDPLRPVPGGLTADGAAERALRTLGPTLMIARAQLELARAQAAEAGRSMLPQLSTAFRYTRLSNYLVPPIVIAGMSVTFLTPILDQFDWQTTLTIPVTDIPLRLLPQFQAANLNTASSELNLESTRAQAGLEAREAFYEYVRNVGQEYLVVQSIASLQRRRADVEQGVAAGTVARAQLLQIDAQIADLQRSAVFAHSFVVVNETLVRQRLHMRPDEAITIGESLDGTPPMPATVTDLLARAYTTRPEIIALDRQIEALDRSVFATRASQFPSVAVVGHADYANPNSRFFPQTSTWQSTWDANIQVSWNATQALVADATISRLRAQQAILTGQQAQLREGVEVQVRQYYLAAQQAVAQAESTRVALQSANENYRVTQERIGAGAAVAYDLMQAETDLLRARLNAINAVIDARLAVARIRRATGERETVDMHP